MRGELGILKFGLPCMRPGGDLIHSPDLATAARLPKMFGSPLAIFKAANWAAWGRWARLKGGGEFRFGLIFLAGGGNCGCARLEAEAGPVCTTNWDPEISELETSVIMLHWNLGVLLVKMPWGQASIIVPLLWKLSRNFARCLCKICSWLHLLC